MDVLHEEVLERIADIKLGPDFFDARIDRKVNDLRDEINDRLVPLETAMRQRPQ